MSIITKESNPELYNALFTEDKTAKEIFEELDYREYTTNIKHLSLVTFDRKCIKAYEKYNSEYHDFLYVLFFDDKSILKWNYSHQRYMYITCEELKAINKQAEELGWND